MDINEAIRITEKAKCLSKADKARIIKALGGNHGS